MTNKKTHKEPDLFDTWDFLNPNRRRMLEEDWPGLFKQHLLCELPAANIHPLLTDGFSQSSADSTGLLEEGAVSVFLKEFYTILGALFLQQIMDLNDYDTVRQVAFNIEWQYALNITEDIDKTKYISEQSICAWRQTLIEHNLDQIMFDNCSDKLALVFKVNTDELCIDPVHLKSNFRRLSCIGSFSQSINKFLVDIVQHHEKLFTSVPLQLRERYASSKALTSFLLVKPSESAKTLQQVSADLDNLVGQFKDQDAVCTLRIYKELQRALNDQRNAISDDNAGKADTRKAKNDRYDQPSVRRPSEPKKNRHPIQSRLKKNMKKIIFSMAAAFGVTVYLFFMHGNEKGAHVNVITVGTGKIMSTLNATGKVVSKEKARISASVSARMESINVDEGVRVAKGALMAQFDDREQREKIASAEASLREAEEKVRLKEKDYKALKEIFAVGGVSRQSVQDAKSSLEMAKSEEELALAELNQAQIVLGKLKVIAPFEGIVTSRNVHPGEWVAAGAVILILSNESNREIEVMVDESDGGFMRIGQKVELTSDAFEDHTWQERVEKISPSISKEGTANFIKIYVSYGEDSPDLKIGQQVDAKIQIAFRPYAVKVPYEAIINSKGRSCVAVVKDDVIRYVPIVTGIEDSLSIEIVEGVSAGQEVILPGGKSLKEGDRVELITREISLK